MLTDVRPREAINCRSLFFSSMKQFWATDQFLCAQYIFLLPHQSSWNVFNIGRCLKGGKYNFSLRIVLTQESKSSPIWSITEDSFLFRTAAICSSIEAEIPRRGTNEQSVCATTWKDAVCVLYILYNIIIVTLNINLTLATRSCFQTWTWLCLSHMKNAAGDRSGQTW